MQVHVNDTLPAVLKTSAALYANFIEYYNIKLLLPIHMGQYQLLSVLAARLSPLNIDHSGNLPVEICGINYTEKYTNL